MAIKLKPLARQAIVVTGASSGIGLVTAREAARRGARVLLVARDGAALERIVAGIVADGGEADFAVADVGDREAVERAAARAVERFGGIDTWVNDAGSAIYAKLLDTPMAEHEALFRTNYFGVVHGVLAAMPHLRARGGALITVASIAADIPSPIMGAYAASKHAVQGYIHSLRVETIADGLPVSITLVKPAGIDTPIAEKAVVHGRGEGMIPPPVYDPAIVARAILDAAEHPRRDVTVGGIGRAQVLIVQHAPWLLDHLGRFMIPLLLNPGRPTTKGDTLTHGHGEGRERSRTQPGRRFSVYTAVRRHPAALAAGLLGLAAVGALRRRARG
jgi:short-subunit dehydrogenase